MQGQGSEIFQSASRIFKTVPGTGGVSFFGIFIVLFKMLLKIALLYSEYTFYFLTYPLLMVCLAERSTLLKYYC